MKDPKGRKVVGFEKHVFVCENKIPLGIVHIHDLLRLTN